MIAAIIRDNMGISVGYMGTWSNTASGGRWNSVGTAMGEQRDIHEGLRLLARLIARALLRDGVCPGETPEEPKGAKDESSSVGKRNRAVRAKKKEP